MGGQDMNRKRTKRINWNKELKNLGVDMDVTIAQRLGVSPLVVWKKRQELGIPRSPKARGRRIDWRKELKNLGVEPDIVIAERVGVTRECVRQRRVKLGIPRPLKSIRPTKRVRLVRIDPEGRRQELERAL